MKNILTALSKCKFNAIKKDSENPHFKNRYASLEAVIDATEEELKKNGMLFIDTFDGEILKVSLWHIESQEHIDSVIPLLMTKRDPQGLMSASTYARRYGKLSILNMVAEDDDGEGAIAERKPIKANDDSVERKRLLQEVETLYKQVKNPSEILRAFYDGSKNAQIIELKKGVIFIKQKIKEQGAQ